MLHTYMCRLCKPAFMHWVCMLLILSLCVLGHAQFPRPLDDVDLTVIRSRINPNITISFKSPPIGTCTTVFTTQKQFTGYIKLPPNILSPTQGDYTINTFFWFIEARQVPENAPLTVFINGGPGSSSMVGLFQEVGPCEVVEAARGKLGTIAREWGWDRSSNILFVDQPVQVGLSFDTQTNGSINLLDELVSMPPTARPITQPSYSFLNGTFSSGNPAFTANTSQLAAQSLWHFLQSFVVTFPEYDPQSRKLNSTARSRSGINLFTESYGGKYAPAIAKFFRQQNALRRTDPTRANSTLEMNIASLGIINGWIDLITQVPFHPRFAYNNTYGIQAISQVQQLNALSSFSATDGCRAKTLACRGQQSGFDSSGSGSLPFVNDLCSNAAILCQNDVIAPYLSSGRSIYDISQKMLDPFPNSLYLDYLNTATVQQAIGTSINYTQNSLAVSTAFSRTGDYARDGVLDDLVDELMAGTRVALIYGDRDYICNWLGGEAVSFALAGRAGLGYRGWYAAGYAPIVTNNSYIGGVVREFGNLSFSRIYDAGHLVPSYQPETAFTLFSRIIHGVGLSLGNVVDRTSFASAGEPNSTRKNTAPAMNDPKCYVRAINTTCDVDQKNMLANGGGVIVNGILYKAVSDWKSPAAYLTSIVGYPGTAPSNMLSNIPTVATPISSSTRNGGTDQPITTATRIPTGVYTATEIPSMTATTTSNAAGPLRFWEIRSCFEYNTRLLMLAASGLLCLGSI